VQLETSLDIPPRLQASRRPLAPQVSPSPGYHSPNAYRRGRVRTRRRDRDDPLGSGRSELGPRPTSSTPEETACRPRNAIGTGVARSSRMRASIPRWEWTLLLLLSACGTSNSGWQGTATSSSSSSSGGSSPTPAPTDTSGSGSSSGSSPAPVGTGPERISSSSSGGSSGSSGGTPTGSSSGAPSGSSSGSPPPSSTVPNVFDGGPPFSPPATACAGEHYPGRSCVASGCHGPVGPETAFLIAGTVYKDYKGTIPYPGVEVRVQDQSGTALSTYSCQNGNFYIGMGRAATLVLPAIVSARDSMTARPMVTQLTTAGMGSCATSGCHIPGSTPASGAYYPIHVP
jgi:hypothetical protein